MTSVVINVLRDSLRYRDMMKSVKLFARHSNGLSNRCTL